MRQAGSVATALHNASGSCRRRDDRSSRCRTSHPTLDRTQCLLCDDGARRGRDTGVRGHARGRVHARRV